MQKQKKKREQIQLPCPISLQWMLLVLRGGRVRVWDSAAALKSLWGVEAVRYRTRPWVSRRWRSQSLRPWVHRRYPRPQLSALHLYLRPYPHPCYLLPPFQPPSLSPPSSRQQSSTSHPSFPSPLFPFPSPSLSLPLL